MISSTSWSLGLIHGEAKSRLEENETADRDHEVVQGLCDSETLLLVVLVLIIAFGVLIGLNLLVRGLFVLLFVLLDLFLSEQLLL